MRPRLVQRGLSRFATLAIVTAVALLIVASPAAAEPIWAVQATHSSQNMAPGGAGQVILEVENAGDSAGDNSSSSPCPASNCVSLVDRLPVGLTATGYQAYPEVHQNSWQCGGIGSRTVKCTSIQSGENEQGLLPRTNDELLQGSAGAIAINVAVAPSASGTPDNTVTVAGGGAAQPTTVTEPIPFSPQPAGFGVTPGTFAFGPFAGSDPAAALATQAGEHPSELRIVFNMNEAYHDDAAYGEPPTFTMPDETLRDSVVRLPLGLIGNPLALPRCTAAGLSSVVAGGHTLGGSCPPETQVGTVDLSVTGGGGSVKSPVPGTFRSVALYSMVPPQGALAAFAFLVQGVPAYIFFTLDPRENSLLATVSAAPNTAPLRVIRMHIWGVPADPSHDNRRYNPASAVGGTVFPTPSTARLAPFLSLPTRCDRGGQTTLSVDSWEHPSIFKSVELPFPRMGGCAELEFEPEIEAKPTTNKADAPSGLDFHLRIPQNEDPNGDATSQLRDATVTLPEGMAVNPPSADGREACSLAQLGMSAAGVPNGDPVSCPDASKLGTVTAVTPALEDPVQGEVYLAKQNENPFGSLLALYLVLEAPERGLLVKLAGEVKVDPQTGRLTTTFKQNPQLPVEDLELHLYGGARAPLRTPASCGEFNTTSDLTPWASPELPDAAPSASFELTAGPDGGNCPQGGAAAPNSPSFESGTLDPTAGAYSPFVFKLARKDATQGIKAIDTTLPEGLLGKLAGAGECSDAQLTAASNNSGQSEKASPSCPANSQVGTVNVGAGAGPSPLYVQGKAYLAGPYKNAPLSLAIVTPAVAGPFDLGTVVVRTALYVNPETAQIHAVSDEIPQILQGIPLDVRSIALRMDRNQFTLNPTSCDPMSVIGAETSVFGQSAALSNPFQVGDCARLGFAPKLALSLKGKTNRGAHPALRAVLTMPATNQANIARAQVTLPHAEFLDQGHIQNVCTQVQFKGAGCPKSSILGYAEAFSPLLDQPLQGPVYLMSGFGHKLPDVAADLNGQIRVLLHGKVDTGPGGGIRNTFEVVPDAPVTKFTLSLKGGRRGLIQNSEDLCAHPGHAIAKFDAQNGKTHDFSTALKVGGCAKKAHKKHKRRR